MQILYSSHFNVAPVYAMLYATCNSACDELDSVLLCINSLYCSYLFLEFYQNSAKITS